MNGAVASQLYEDVAACAEREDVVASQDKSLDNQGTACSVDPTDFPDLPWETGELPQTCAREGSVEEAALMVP